MAIPPPSLWPGVGPPGLKGRAVVQGGLSPSSTLDGSCHSFLCLVSQPPVWSCPPSVTPHVRPAWVGQMSLSIDAATQVWPAFHLVGGELGYKLCKD